MKNYKDQPARRYLFSIPASYTNIYNRKVKNNVKNGGPTSPGIHLAQHPSPPRGQNHETRTETTGTIINPSYGEISIVLENLDVFRIKLIVALRMVWFSSRLKVSLPYRSKCTISLSSKECKLFFCNMGFVASKMLRLCSIKLGQ